MKARVLTGLVTVLLLAGVACVPLSVQPLYQEDQVISVDGLDGLWTMKGEEGWIRFQPDSLSTGYVLMMSEEANRTSTFEAHPLKIGNMLMVDLFPADPDGDAYGEFYMGHLVPVHSFYRIDEVGPELKISTLDYNWLSDYLRKHPDAIAHTWLGQMPLITASSEDVQTFVKAHASDESAWGEAAEYVKK